MNDRLYLPGWNDYLEILSKNLPESQMEARSATANQSYEEILSGE